ncbi:FKBP-type peptidyl-prolyl cis-trans isomerase [Actinomadura spongiicola]|uniref:Peptidyl-prolyl cis-trans isomerase n=1 Tax=Actinomadura spongiicola TaxID=2303421 RepID=A0A372GFI4_9ACTN|nr:FKBP-type peptidyl-prolyl cis-trans isomerase [Actinomadura spongiicola]
MWRGVRLLWLVVVVLVVSACSGGGAEVGVVVRGDFGRVPEVRFPEGAPSGSFAVRTLVEGRGAAARRGDLVVADYVGYRWNGGGRRLLASSYAEGRPGAFPTGRLVRGLTRALVGARPGSRVVARIPPEDGFGVEGDPGRRVGAGDTLVYVLDVRAVYSRGAGPRGVREAPLEDGGLPRVGEGAAGGAPVVTVPRVAPPEGLRVRALVRGDGPVVRDGQLAVVHFAGVFWRDGRVFDSSWAAGRPSGVVLGSGQVIEGWERGLVGQRVGSRVLLVVPPSSGYGAKGLARFGIRGDDTLVFVVDLLGAH